MSDFSMEMVRQARTSILGTALHTPLIPSPSLSKRAGQEFLLKLDMMQPMGAFKLRGAANAIFNLPDGVKGVTCCSTGNHGRAVTYAANRRQIPATICMSHLVPQAKIDGIEQLGGTCRIIGQSQDEAQEEALRLVAEEGLVEISPFDDPHVIAGQGTLALELLEDCPDLEMVLIPLSGGGLAGGVAYALKQLKPSIQTVGISMDQGAAMASSLQTGHPVEVQEVASLADSLGGGIGLDNKLSFALCQEYLDEVILVSEEEIYHALQWHYYEDRMVCEGASAVGAAALLSGKLPTSKGPTASIITGRNLDMEIHGDIIQGRDVTLGDRTIKGRAWKSGI